MVGTRHCCWGECKTDSRYPEKWLESLKELEKSGQKVFIPFPKPAKDLAKCKRWLVECSREFFTEKNVNWTRTLTALWRKLEPLFSRNKKALRFKRGQRKRACIRGQILPTRNNNYSKSICVPWPLGVKHAAKITFTQYKCTTFQSIIYIVHKLWQ